ncbi:Sodium/proline symporter [Thalassocella blandensis]|nr:Sodium/proline symporter [Thalassocella blandensis]
MVASFLIFLAIFVAVGVSSVLKSRGTKKDYYLASSSVSPALVGLSAVATNNSGYMFIGVIGYTYATGLAAIWIMLGWLAGDFIASTFIHAKLRKSTQSTKEVSFAGVLSNWTGEQYIYLQRLVALISLVFLLAYAGAQLVAGSKALHVLLGWPSATGAIIGAILVVLYCIAGGIRASIWTDAAQSVVMIIAMAMLLIVALVEKGGISASLAQMNQIEGFMDWTPDDLVVPGILGGFVFAISWGFAGFSVIGQPHIMVRFMTLEDNNKMLTARIYYYIWFSLFYAMATIVGMLARIYLVDTASFDAELALPTMAKELLPGMLAGVILAGIFAATMSTADSLVLSCSAAVTHDLIPHKIEKPWLLKVFTVLITAAALKWALLDTQSVFNLVILAWSGLASAFAPLLIVLCLGMRPGQPLSIIAVLTGLFTALMWRYMGWQSAAYEGMAGMIAGLSVLLVGSFILKQVSSQASPQVSRVNS